MILSPMNIELTKVHYYESFRKSRNGNPPGAPPGRLATHGGGWETMDNKININIKRNIFGQKSWTFNVNTPHRNYQQQQSKANATLFTSLRAIASICIFLAVCLSIAVVTVIYVRSAQKHKIIKNVQPGRIIVFDQTEINVEKVLHTQNTRKANANERMQHVQDGGQATKQLNNETSICACKTDEVCLRQRNASPKCTRGTDARDPSGCKGLCALNTEHCRVLDKKLRVYECVQNGGGGLRCPLGYFNCADSLCLHKSHKCDGHVDCPDLSDELDCPCDLSLNFQCGNFTSCHAKSKRCDGRIDCWDSSDETHCNDCPDGALTCNSTGCFLPAQFCDGIPDCADASDEICQTE